MSKAVDNTVRIDFPRYIPFVEHLGMELWALDDGHAELRLNLTEPHMNSLLVAHGGVLMSLMDVAMAHAARSRSILHGESLPDGEPVTPLSSATQGGVVTIEMKTSFMRGAQGVLRAVGTLMHRTATLAFCEAKLYDGSGHVCAHSTGTFKYLRAANRPRATPDPQETSQP